MTILDFCEVPSQAVVKNYRSAKYYGNKKMTNLKSNTPQILIDLVEYLKTNNLIAESNINGEGRAASLKDEESIISFLKKSDKFSKYIVDVDARKAGDFYLLDYDNINTHIINIKTTFGSTDNATCKIGFLWAFTDLKLEELPLNINLKNWHNLMETRKKDIYNKDYWYLTFDKNNMTNVFLRGAKQIVNWKHNASNYLQINWKSEWNTPENAYSFDESYSNIMNGMRECVQKLQKNFPQEWL